MTEDKLEFCVVPNKETGLFTVFRIRKEFIADFATRALAEAYAKQNNGLFASATLVEDHVKQPNKEAETAEIVPKAVKSSPSKPRGKTKKPASAKSKAASSVDAATDRRSANPIPQPNILRSMLERANGQDKEVMPHNTPVGPIAEHNTPAPVTAGADTPSEPLPDISPPPTSVPDVAAEAPTHPGSNSLLSADTGPTEEGNPPAHNGQIPIKLYGDDGLLAFLRKNNVKIEELPDGWFLIGGSENSLKPPRRLDTLLRRANYIRDRLGEPRFVLIDVATPADAA